jgi:hypothetical protein
MRAANSDLSGPGLQVANRLTGAWHLPVRSETISVSGGHPASPLAGAMHDGPPTPSRPTDSESVLSPVRLQVASARRGIGDSDRIPCGAWGRLSNAAAASAVPRQLNRSVFTARAPLG